MEQSGAVRGSAGLLHFIPFDGADMMKRLLIGGVLVTAFSGGWVIQPSETRSSFRGLSVVDARTVWVSGSRAKFLRTVDGATWRRRKWVSSTHSIIGLPATSRSGFAFVRVRG